jgi:hypothetical protein
MTNPDGLPTLTFVNDFAHRMLTDQGVAYLACQIPNAADPAASGIDCYHTDSHYLDITADGEVFWQIRDFPTELFYNDETIID